MNLVLIPTQYLQLYDPINLILLSSRDSCLQGSGPLEVSLVDNLEIGEWIGFTLEQAWIANAVEFILGLLSLFFFFRIIFLLLARFVLNRFGGCLLLVELAHVNRAHDLIQASGWL